MPLPRTYTSVLAVPRSIPRMRVIAGPLASSGHGARPRFVPQRPAAVDRCETSERFATLEYAQARGDAPTRDRVPRPVGAGPRGARARKGIADARSAGQRRRTRRATTIIAAVARPAPTPPYTSGLRTTPRTAGPRRRPRRATTIIAAVARPAPTPR